MKIILTFLTALLVAANSPAAAQDEKSWRVFVRRFRAEMKSPEASRDLDLLAALSHQTNFAMGCYCEDENRCHRSILRELLLKRGADVR